MSTMVARGSNPSISVQEKGSRNKRKFCADPPIFDPNFIANQVNSDWTTLDLSLLDQNPEIFGLGSNDHEDNTYDDPVTPVYHPNKLDVNQLHEGEWNAIAESELEASLLKNMHLMFSSAIKIIMSYGYSEEIAIVAILRTALCFGAKDVLMNIVDNALQLLASGQAIELLMKEKLLEELKERETSALNEMISVVREFRPWFSRGEAMWRLLISDMSVFHVVSTASTCPSAPQLEQEEPKSSNSSIQTNSKSHPSVPLKPNLILPNPKNTDDKDIPNVIGIPSLPNGRFSASIKDSPTSLDCVVRESSLYVSQPKQSNGKKGQSGRSKREFLRQKTVHLEKSCRKPGSKTIIRGSRHSSLSDMLFNHTSRVCPDPSNALNMENTLMKLKKAVGGDIIPPQRDASLKLPFSDLPVKMTSVASTELSLCLPSTSNIEKWIPQDKIDEMIQTLSICEKKLEIETKEWSEWAQQKVMEAARRLQQDKPELQSLRQEKDEVARLKKEKQSLENNTRKQLAEMEIALSQASAQVEKHKAEAGKKERENAELRKELAASKSQAAESASSCREYLKKYLNLSNNVNARSWEREKAQLQEELANKKKRFNGLKRQLGQAKEHYDHLEARWKKEAGVKQQLLDQYNALVKEREHVEVSGRSKENAMRINSETGLQRHKDEIRKLEFQISQLRLKTDSSKIAALKKWGNDPKEENNNNNNNNTKLISMLFQAGEGDEDEDVDREKECVMCLYEEKSIVFLPCTHQVLCETCNATHEKQGMNDCPACRTIIDKRIVVRFA